MGKNARLNPMNISQKFHLPSRSLSSRRLFFGSQ
jgi:hypothetical protein